MLNTSIFGLHSSRFQSNNMHLIYSNFKSTLLGKARVVDVITSFNSAIFFLDQIVGSLTMRNLYYHGSLYVM